MKRDEGHVHVHVHTCRHYDNYSTDAFSVYTASLYSTQPVTSIRRMVWRTDRPQVRSLPCDWLSFRMVCISDCSNTLLMSQSGARTVKTVDDDNSIGFGSTLISQAREDRVRIKPGEKFEIFRKPFSRLKNILFKLFLDSRRSVSNSHSFSLFLYWFPLWNHSQSADISRCALAAEFNIVSFISRMWTAPSRFIYIVLHFAQT